MTRAEEMRELLARWKDSGLNLMAFGKKEGIPYSRLLYWKRGLQVGSPKEGVSVESASSSGGMVPVRVIPEASSEPRQGKFEVWLANGISLEIPFGFDKVELQRLVGVLSEC